MRWDALLLLLYGIAIVFVIFEFSGLWSLSLILMIVLLISLIQKIYFDKEFRKNADKNNMSMGVISEKVDIIISSIGELGKSNKINADNIKNSILEDIENILVDLRKRIVDTESRLIEIKESLDTTKNDLEKRILHADRTENTFSDDN
jgi:hypothetical protein